jgi:hypothetical protein
MIDINNYMKDKDSTFLFEAYSRVMLREEYYDCYRDCKGLGGSHSECHDECAHLEEEGTGSGHEHDPATIKQRKKDRETLRKSNPDLPRMRARAKEKMGINLTPDDKRALGKGDVIEDDEDDYKKRAHAAGEKFGKSGMKMFVDPEEDEADASGDDNYLRDVLGMEPEDFEHEDPDQAAMDRADRENGLEVEEHPNKEWLNIASAFINTAMAGNKERALEIGRTLLGHYDGHSEDLPMDPSLVVQVLRDAGASEEEIASIE